MYHSSRIHLNSWWPYPRVHVSYETGGGCYPSSRANHCAGSDPDREAGSVKGKSLAGMSTPLSKCGTGLQPLFPHRLRGWFIVAACAATVMRPPLKVSWPLDRRAFLLNRTWVTLAVLYSPLGWVHLASRDIGAQEPWQQNSRAEFCFVIVHYATIHTTKGWTAPISGPSHLRPAGS
jgi:hypothetical protein